MSYLVTAGPPTPNGDLHLGHLSGPYLAGDILTRYLR
ncbi:class I tRNA ligase family protein, partial [Acinetobacter baumannii]